jgi:hypothetical protein
MKTTSHDLDVLDKDRWIKTDYGLYYKKDKIKFIRLASRESLKDIIKLIDAFSIDEKIGVICTALKESDLIILREKKISYLINNREIKIFGKEKGQILRTSFSNILLGELTPTLLVSPTGLEIIDTIIKLPSNQLKNVTSTKLCKNFDLSRPKLSNIMKAFRVDNLVELKNELLNLEISWWLEAFNTPITKRKMTPFQTKKTRRYTLKDNLDDFQFRDLIHKLKEENIDAELGGLSYLKILGSIRTNEYDVVVRADQVIDVVRKMNLRPAKKDERERNIFITPIGVELREERFYAKVKNDRNYFSDLENLNPLRFLWGLNYEESRVQEVKKNLLEMYFNEARKYND